METIYILFQSIGDSGNRFMAAYKDIPAKKEIEKIWLKTKI